MKPLLLLILLQAASSQAEICGLYTGENPIILKSTQSIKIGSRFQDDGALQLTVSPVNPASIASFTVVPLVSIQSVPIISGMVQILPSPSLQLPETQGTIITSLDTFGHATRPPIIQTLIPVPTTILSPATATQKTSSIQSTLVSPNIFQPVATDAPPTIFATRSDHPVPRLNIKPQTEPLSTNKFYSNFFLGSQKAGTWTHPYSLAWVKGSGSSKSWGMSIMHVEASQKVFGPDPKANPARFFTNPIGILSIILSSSNLGSSTFLTTDDLTSTSVNVNLHPSAGAPAQITFPLVQGMGFVTAIFQAGIPILQSTVLFRTFTKVFIAPKPGVSKFKIVLEDGTNWLLYAYSPSIASLDFTVVSNGLIKANSEFHGIIQISKNPSGNNSAEAIYDAACGAFATSVDISGSASGDSGSYTFSFVKGGMENTTLVMFALPHHMSSFSPQTSAAATNIQLETTSKGKATAVIADSWTMVERLPITMGFEPWSPHEQNQKHTWSQATAKTIHTVACSEISQNMSDQTNLDSMYFSGKALAKFAVIAYTLQERLDDAAMAQAGLEHLKKSFALFASNKNKFPLVYECAWKGIVSSASYSTGDPGIDFGNTYYNDHHFHYGYFILAAAMIGSIDPEWITPNRAYVNTLVRDIANPSSLDAYFPVSRNFDWYHGHSWAHGLYETFDGKDQESSSEDSMSAYALKMWGQVSGDANMEARGNLQLAVNARSIQSYYLYQRDSSIEPPNFISNKVAGILFENKIDHTTFFGQSPEFVHGIHMIPILPSSGLTRTRQFVQEEWDSFFSNGRADTAQGGWRSLLYANLALANPKAAWQYFSSPSFDDAYLDGGASRTWYMALAAGNIALPCLSHWGIHAKINSGLGGDR